MFYVTIETLDKSLLTKRTNSYKCKAFCARLPRSGEYQHYVYCQTEDTKHGDSTGIAVATNNVEQIGNEYKFYSHENTPFKVTLIGEKND